MINFSKISNEKIIGKILRVLLKLIPQNTTVSIVQGKLKGKKWIKGSGVNGYWLGSYESEKVSLFEKTLKKGNTVFDIGAHVGFYTLLSAELAGKEGKVFSFEPLTANYEYLKKHIEINNYKNIIPFNVAVSDKDGFASFKQGENTSTGQLTSEGEIRVRTIAIDDWINNKKLPVPDILKIDVEGAEFAVLKGAVNLLNRYHPIIFLSTHSGGIHKKCCDLLLSLGYKLKPLGINNDELLNSSSQRNFSTSDQLVELF
jgi:FkbM family methyltransferase